MSYQNTIDLLEQSKVELENEQQFLDEEKRDLLKYIDKAIEAIENLWGK